MISCSDFLINRFSTATFDFNSLLIDFKEILFYVRKSLKTPQPLFNYLMEIYLNKFDNLLANKIITNPERFLFGNAIIWNSFLSAFENDERVSLSYSREVISSLIMIENFSLQPQVKEDIAPNLSPETIAFILKNYHSDQNITKVHSSKFFKHYKIKKQPKTAVIPYNKVQPLTFSQYTVNYDDWCFIGKNEKCLQRYKFMANYIRKPE